MFKQKKGVGLLLFLVWLVYATCYLGKLNYSANITQVIDFYQITKAEAGMVPTLFFFSYGIGQVVNGILCKKFHIKWMVFCGLFFSAVINLVVAVTTNFTLIKWLWLANGFLLSILWPTLLRLIAESMPQKALSKSSLVMGTTVASGTLVIYALSALYVSMDKFKLAFYTAAVAGVAVSVLWLLLYNRAVGSARAEMLAEEKKDAGEEKVQDTERTVSRKSLLVTVGILCFSAIGVNLIKDGLTTWVPSILKEEGSMEDSMSILLTLSLTVVAIFGNTFSLYLHKKLPNYISQSLITFVVLAVFIGVVIGCLSLKLVAMMLFGLIMAKFLASSMNSLITSIFPMFMRRYVNSGLSAGVLNGFCYVGSAISSYGLGAIADNFGWSAVFWFLLGVCCVISAVCGIALVLSVGKKRLTFSR